MIEIENVSKSFGKKKALCNVNLSLDLGIYGLLGPNGAGKTTFMRILATVLEMDSGRISMDDITWEDKLKVRERIGYLPQHFSMYGGLSVYESLCHVAVLKNIEKRYIDSVVNAVIDEVNLTDRKTSRISALSGGMLRRLGIAQALIGNPRILIVDEPTAGLDPEERIRFRNLLSGIGDRRTILISTHIVEDVEAVCERMGVLNQGGVMIQGDVEDIVAKVQGKVYEYETDRKIESGNGWTVISQRRQRDRFIYRILSDQEVKGAVHVRESLEDAYIYLTGGGARQNENDIL